MDGGRPRAGVWWRRRLHPHGPEHLLRCRTCEYTTARRQNLKSLPTTAHSCSDYVSAAHMGERSAAIDRRGRMRSSASRRLCCTVPRRAPSGLRNAWHVVRATETESAAQVVGDAMSFR